MQILGEELRKKRNDDDVIRWLTKRLTDYTCICFVYTAQYAGKDMKDFKLLLTPFCPGARGL